MWYRPMSSATPTVSGAMVGSLTGSLREEAGANEVLDLLLRGGMPAVRSLTGAVGGIAGPFAGRVSRL